MAEHLIRDSVPHPPQRPGLARRATSEALGTALLFATVVGSGIMAESLAQGNDAVALLGNSIATAAILFVIIAMFAPVSGAHFNPAVTLAAVMRAEIDRRDAFVYIAVQFGAGIAAIFLTHAMFEQPIVQFSDKSRAGFGMMLGEAVATFGLILTIIGTVRHRPEWIAPAVALYICAGYWFTSSTSFANPAIAVARSFSDSFAGIAMADLPGFIAAQLVGAMLAVAIGGWVFARD